jgi:hypothetical protein
LEAWIDIEIDPRRHKKRKRNGPKRHIDLNIVIRQKLQHSNILKHRNAKRKEEK